MLLSPGLPGLGRLVIRARVIPANLLTDWAGAKCFAYCCGQNWVLTNCSGRERMSRRRTGGLEPDMAGLVSRAAGQRMGWRYEGTVL